MSRKKHRAYCVGSRLRLFQSVFNQIVPHEVRTRSHGSNRSDTGKQNQGEHHRILDRCRPTLVFEKSQHGFHDAPPALDPADSLSAQICENIPTVKTLRPDQGGVKRKIRSIWNFPSIRRDTARRRNATSVGMNPRHIDRMRPTSQNKGICEILLVYFIADCHHLSCGPVDW